MGPLRGGDADAARIVSRSVSLAGTGVAVEPVSCRPDRSGCEPADRTLELRAGGEVLHGGWRTRSRGRGRRGGRSRVAAVAEDRVHGGEVADHAPAGALSRPGGIRISPGCVSRSADQLRKPAAVYYRVAHVR